MLKAVCARNAERRSVRRQLGLRADRDGLAQVGGAPDIDLIDIGSPNNTHYEIALAAAQGGQDDRLRKAAGHERAQKREEMVKAVEAAGVPNMVWFNYRRVPPIALAKQLVDEGRIGRPFHYRATYLQDWTISRRRAAGRRGAVAAGRQRRRLGRNRRSAGAFDRHGDVAERTDHVAWWRRPRRLSPSASTP